MVWGNQISLAELYKFAEKHRHDREALRIEKRIGLGREYTKLCEDITDDVGEEQGFYLWGCYDREGGLWRNIYLGMAGYGDKKSLKRRITDELKKERACIWRHLYTPKELMEIRDDIHNGKYARGWKRAMRKAGTTHIVWVAAPEIERSKVRDVESDLIEALSPRANLQRHAPPGDLQSKAADVFAAFRRIIHNGRASGFSLNVKDGLALDELLAD